MTWIQTSSGVKFDLLKPHDGMVRLHDIAQGLSRVHRFGGHTPVPYTVAQHSVHVSEICERMDGRRAAIDGLFHDAAEAYLGDLPAQAKALCPDYQRLEARVWGAVAAAYSLRTARDGAVGVADQAMLAAEALRFFPPDKRPDDWGLTAAPARGMPDAIWTAETARQRFLDRAVELSVGFCPCPECEGKAELRFLGVKETPND